MYNNSFYSLDFHFTLLNFVMTHTVLVEPPWTPVFVVYPTKIMLVCRSV
jgi:hypothetical protein